MPRSFARRYGGPGYCGRLQNVPIVVYPLATTCGNNIVLVYLQVVLSCCLFVALRQRSTAVEKYETTQVDGVPVAMFPLDDQGL